MARNAELIRQWEILREIDGARTGVAVPKLAALRHVHPRTIRRDIEALCTAGFPLYDEKINGTSMWKLRAKPFRALEETGLSVTELCALYFSRSMIVALTGAPFMDDVERAIMKIERALPPMCRKYLDAVGGLVKAKSTGRKKQNEKKLREITARLTDASLTHCRIQMRYRSASSRRTKEYVVEPLRLAYAEGGMYLTAYVPAYEEVRTFALERIETLGVLDEHFEPRPLPSQPFANSLGVNTGSPELIEIEFDADAAPYVSEREWHRSQEIIRRPDGSIVLRLCVCNDKPLRAWILGFGAAARVVMPAMLAADIATELERARQRYPRRPARFEMLQMTVEPPAVRIGARSAS
jgi:predicted DNA-binding transcriptional regulator YafY